MTKATRSSVMAVALLAGCAAMHPPVERTSAKLACDSGRECVVNVDVTCERFYGCRLAVDHDLVLVMGRGKPTSIVWRLAGESGARFTSNGIVLDSSDFDCAAGPETKEFKCTDRHGDFGVFKYRVNVSVPQSPFGPRGVPSLDPWIVND